VVGEGDWRSRLDADPRAIGRTLTLNGASFEIVGIAPAGFHGTYHARPSDLWTAIARQDLVRPRGLALDNRNWGWLRMIARRRPDVSLDAAQAQLDAAAAGVNRRFPPGQPGQALRWPPRRPAPSASATASCCRRSSRRRWRSPRCCSSSPAPTSRV
jgi:hypothetical protein